VSNNIRVHLLIQIYWLHSGKESNTDMNIFVLLENKFILSLKEAEKIYTSFQKTFLTPKN
jgi:hypothetical protein